MIRLDVGRDRDDQRQRRQDQHLSRCSQIGSPGGISDTAGSTVEDVGRRTGRRARCRRRTRAARRAPAAPPTTRGRTAGRAVRALTAPSAIESGDADHARRGAPGTPSSRAARRARSVTGCSRRQRVPEIAREQPAEPVQVLADDGLLEVELRAQRGERVRRGRAAEDRAGGVARQRLGRGEDDDRDEQQRQHAEQRCAG